MLRPAPDIPVRTKTSGRSTADPLGAGGLPAGSGDLLLLSGTGPLWTNWIRAVLVADNLAG